MQQQQEKALKQVGNILKGMRQANRLEHGRVASSIGCAVDIIRKAERGRILTRDQLERVIQYFNPRGENLEVLEELLCDAFPSSRSAS